MAELKVTQIKSKIGGIKSQREKRFPPRAQLPAFLVNIE